MRLRRRRGWTTVRVISGLGNQLFQYAAGRAVAERTNTRLRFDISYLDHEADRPYALGDFHIRAEVVGGEARDRAFMADHAAEDAYARERFGASVVREVNPTHETELLSAAPADSFLAGYWQNGEYFEQYARAIRRELRPRMTAAIRSGRRAIAESDESVALHVRRGDFASDAGSAARFGALEADYYGRAANLVLERRPRATFFIFSDDPEWCRAELRLPGPAQIVSGTNRPFEDLALIAACNDAIVSNSTFAWWGAWLGERPDSLIVAPKVPFNEPLLNQRSTYPDRWLRV
ncbi:MAG: alpha-1,2-fucosyltransferase [Thermoleophilaceae bacterium]|nr:alpha-1,2-fucosyltransferase [Thermoleophilaceae bacterium]